MTTITACVDNRLLGELSRFFGGFPAMMKEIFQNAYRASATTLTLSLNADGNILTVVDNGTGCDDPQLLLAAGRTGWNEDQVVEPAGLGVFSLLDKTLVAWVLIQSKDWAVLLHPEKVLAGKPINIQPPSHQGPGLRLDLQFKKTVALKEWQAQIESARGAYPMKVTLNGHELPIKTWDPELEITTSVGRIGIRRTQNDHSHYNTRRRMPIWEHRRMEHDTHFYDALVLAAKRMPKPVLAAEMISEYGWYWQVDSASGVRPKLPDRSSLIPSVELNTAAEILMRAVYSHLDGLITHALTNIPDYFANTHGPEQWRKQVHKDLGLAQTLYEDSLRAYGWRKIEVTDYASAYVYNNDDSSGVNCTAGAIIYDKHAQPVPFAGVADQLNLLRISGKFPHSVYCSADGDESMITIKGRKPLKESAYVQLVTSIEVYGVKLPYLLWDEWDGTEWDNESHKQADSDQPIVLVVGKLPEALATVGQNALIGGFALQAFWNHDDAYDMDLSDEDDNWSDAIEFLLDQLIDDYATDSQKRAMKRANATEKLTGVIATAIGGFHRQKTGITKLDSEVARLHKRLEKLLAATQAEHKRNKKLSLLSLADPMPVKAKAG